MGERREMCSLSVCGRLGSPSHSFLAPPSRPSRDPSPHHVGRPLRPHLHPRHHPPGFRAPGRPVGRRHGGRGRAVSLKSGSFFDREIE
jgi:hypothetical protein